jgi:hypothetical protein
MDLPPAWSAEVQTHLDNNYRCFHLHMMCGFMRHNKQHGGLRSELGKGIYTPVLLTQLRPARVLGRGTRHQSAPVSKPVLQNSQRCTGMWHCILGGDAIAEVEVVSHAGPVDREARVAGQSSRQCGEKASRSIVIRPWWSYCVCRQARYYHPGSGKPGLEAAAAHASSTLTSSAGGVAPCYLMQEMGVRPLPRSLGIRPGVRGAIDRSDIFVSSASQPTWHLGETNFNLELNRERLPAETPCLVVVASWRL